MAHELRRYNKHLVELPLLTLQIAEDIELSNKFYEFGLLIGKTPTDLERIRNHTNFNISPSYEAMMQWQRSSPQVNSLAKILFQLGLEESFQKLENELQPAMYQYYIQKFQLNERHDFIEENFFLDTNEDSSPSTVEYLLPRSNVDIEPHQIPNNLNIDRRKNEEKQNILISIIKSILQTKSTDFNVKDLTDIQKKASSDFTMKIQNMSFNAKLFHLDKILKSESQKKKVYNTIWCLTNIKLPSLPSLLGYSLFDNYLLLFFPSVRRNSLFRILHGIQKDNQPTISATRRIQILQVVGEALCFLHLYTVYHGSITSSNVLISNNDTILSGFEKCRTKNSDYLQGLLSVGQYPTKENNYKQKDIEQYLALICETWWNVSLSKNQSLVEFVDCKPKSPYPGWNENVHGTICQLITRYTGSLDNISISEIVDNLRAMEDSSDMN